MCEFNSPRAVIGIEIIFQYLEPSLRVAVGEQVAIIYACTKGFVDSVPVEQVKAFETEFLSTMTSQHKDVIDGLAAGKLTDEITGTLSKVAEDIASRFTN